MRKDRGNPSVEHELAKRHLLMLFW